MISKYIYYIGGVGVLFRSKIVKSGKTDRKDMLQAVAWLER